MITHRLRYRDLLFHLPVLPLPHLLPRETLLRGLPVTTPVATRLRLRFCPGLRLFIAFYYGYTTDSYLVVVFVTPDIYGLLRCQHTDPTDVVDCYAHVWLGCYRYLVSYHITHYRYLRCVPRFCLCRTGRYNVCFGYAVLDGVYWHTYLLH